MNPNDILLKKMLYIKDGNGDTMNIKASIYKDQIIHHTPFCPNIQNILQDLQNFAEKEDDVWIHTFPKSGTHWMHEIVGILLSGRLQPVKDFKQNEMLEIQHSLSDIENLPSPRVINDHLLLKYLPAAVVEKSKMICVVRNPKSCAVSYYHNLMEAQQILGYKGTFDGFLTWFNQGFDDIWGSWYENVQETWDVLHKRPNVHFVFYEELLKNPLPRIKEVAAFLGVERDDAFCQGVVDLTSLKDMSECKGKDLTSKWYNMMCRDGKNVIFRKGIADDWKNYFTKEENQTFDAEYEEKMMNYPELKSRIKFE